MMFNRSFQKSVAKGLVAGATALLLLSQTGAAQQLRLTPGTPPAHPGHTPLYTVFQAQLPELTEGRMRGVILGTEVANIGNMRTAIRSGLSDVGMFLPAYFPSDLPNVNLVGDLSFMGTNSQAMGAAMTEYIVNCADCQAELKRLGVVYTTSHASDTYQILTTKPIRNVEDLRGLRLRVGGPHYARWAEAMGAVGANVSVGETFEAISQGVLDGTIASSADMISFRLDDVVTHVSTLRLGTYHSTISHAVGNNTWARLSANDRRAIAEASTLASAMSTQRWAHEMAGAAEAGARTKGIEFIEPSAALVAASDAFKARDLDSIVGRAEGRDGLTNVAAKMAEFERLVDKWTAFAESVDNDPEKMAEQINREVWANVDFTRYGL
ncbi:C4-dicarboxylate TRAP transporter substrate-binding protein [Salinispirillum sp. LH 10-3-1]|uniref:C4-dicarboxylate TRAP transporter substrate-binding protein n=1 Tax=Salinispirillum sp. LH 10-3-1 TaxID=2952525 RepID=A0AB38YGK9_9GAMM